MLAFIVVASLNWTENETGKVENSVVCFSYNLTFLCPWFNLLFPLLTVSFASLFLTDRNSHIERTCQISKKLISKRHLNVKSSQRSGVLFQTINLDNKSYSIEECEILILLNITCRCHEMHQKCQSILNILCRFISNPQTVPKSFLF